MVSRSGLRSLLSDSRRAFIFLAASAVVVRLAIWLLIPLDWNWDSYHHWQISYLSLKIGFSRGRLWDLNGCEYYWGAVPHVTQALLLWLLSTASLAPYRVLNTLLGGVNAGLVYLIGSEYYSERTGLYAGLLFAVFPVGAVFDAVAMQDTLALTFALLSLYLFRGRTFWSGVALALAAQSRTEFWLVSAAIVLGAALVDRLSTERIPFLLGWLTVMGGFGWFFWIQTGNPAYPLYWSLYNVFGGWGGEGQGQPFLRLMLDWVLWKLRVWPTKPTGVLLLGAVFGFFALLIHEIRRRPENYSIHIYFMSTLMVLGPIFVPYAGSSLMPLLIMLRMMVPIVALGSSTLVHLVSEYEPVVTKMRGLQIEKGLILISLLSFAYFVPAYGGFQGETVEAFLSADKAMVYYRGGTVVCDYPTMNYRFVNRWRMAASDLMGNHYAPSYFGVSDPREYARWLEENHVTLWIRSDYRAAPVWSVVEKSYPDLLVFLEEIGGSRFYSVNQTELERVLPRESVPS